ncbi:hypothetical protein [Aureispira anguillae]|uniref:Uncharacterized protein n=1 Tax=Aureispira anguillae TaxID=2864201 RepID=A0A916DX88_9BACT|nr:hypothetical protein [Aureispira anguillae]BDS15505.1 hypothetical protein AsAng_0062890 [Aureispira anguillae]
MNRSKLITVLSQLSTRNLANFKEYVHSPFFNKHKATTTLLDCLLEYGVDFQETGIDKRKIFSVVFPKLAFNEVKFNYVVSKLLELLSNFLAYQEYEQNEFRKKYYALKAVHQLGVPKQAASHIRQHRLLQEHYPFQTANLYYEKYLYYEMLNQIHLDKNQRLYDENLQLQNDQLDAFYFAQKLKMACDMLSRNIVIQANYKVSYIEQLLVEVKQGSFELEKHPIVHIYYQILQTLRDSKDADYQALKVLVERYATFFLPEELLLIYDYAENFCIRKINNGATRYYNEFLNIYKQKLAKKLLFEEGYLSESDYKNIVTAGVRTKDYAWTEQFIHTNKRKLRSEVQENAFNYNLAVFYYATKQYTKALQLLMTISVTDISYGVGAKTVQLQSYYELQEFEPLINLIDTFRLYVMRHKTQSDYRKKATLNMLRIVKKAAKLKEKSTFLSQNKLDKEYTKLKDLYTQTTPLSNADWIKEIIEELVPSGS